MINPKLLCDRHLLGEHLELHKHLPSFKKRHSISNRVSPVVQIEPLSMQSRHDMLAEEIGKRWPKNNPHRSPFPVDIKTLLEYLPERERSVKVDLSISETDLCNRCPSCRERILRETSRN